jgi:hypothetical protein
MKNLHNPKTQIPNLAIHFQPIPQSDSPFFILGFELRMYTLSHSTQLCLSWIFFKIGSQELVAWAGFEL